MIKKIIINEVFEIALELYYSNTVEDLIEYMTIEEEDFASNSSVSSFVNYNKEDHHIRLFLYSKEPDVISHEASHIAMITMKQAGIPINFENDEVFAYLIGFYVREIYKVINKKNIKNKK